jgi:hypothetical protein
LHSLLIRYTWQKLQTCRLCIEYWLHGEAFLYFLAAMSSTAITLCHFMEDHVLPCCWWLDLQLLVFLKACKLESETALFTAPIICRLSHHLRSALMSWLEWLIAPCVTATDAHLQQSWQFNDTAQRRLADSFSDNTIPQ